MTITDNDTTTDDAEEAITDAASAAGAVPDELIDAVMANVDAGGMELLGPDGVLGRVDQADPRAGPVRGTGRPARA